MRTLLGVDCFDKKDYPLDQRDKILFIGNQSSFDSSYTPSLDKLIREGLKINYLIAPEHGLFGFFQDMETFQDNYHPYYNLPIISLYGKNEDTLSLGEEFIENSSIIIDIQDIGSRYYTYIWTLFKLLLLSSSFDTEIIILDRPNPIMPMDIHGPPIQKGFETFVGNYSIPIIHGLTIGEFALYIKAKLSLKTDLKVIKMKNYSREMFYDDTGLPWGFPSPNMPVLETALLYPGACLLEGTNLSEGRGTTKPFSLIGAPYIDPYKLDKEMKNIKDTGILFKPIFFRPMFNKHSQEICGGLEIIVSDRIQCKPVKFYLNLINIIRKLYPGHFDWRREEYEYRKDLLAFDMLMGSNKTRNYLEKGIKIDIILEEWKYYEKEYKNEIQNLIMYR